MKQDVSPVHYIFLFIIATILTFSCYRDTADHDATMRERAVREKACGQFATIARSYADSLTALKDCAAWGVPAPYDLRVRRK